MPKESLAFTESGQFAEKTDVFSAQCPSKTGLENQFLSVKARLSFGKNL
jgi:hypothetical protein